MSLVNVAQAAVQHPALFAKHAGIWALNHPQAGHVAKYIAQTGLDRFNKYQTARANMPGPSRPKTSRASNTSNPLNANVLGNSTRIRIKERVKRRRKVPKAVKRFNKRIKKIVRNTNELHYIRNPHSLDSAHSVNPRQRQYNIPSGQCVMFKIWNGEATGANHMTDMTHVDSLFPKQPRRANAADQITPANLGFVLDHVHNQEVAINQFKGDEFYSEGLSIKFLVRHNMLETAPGHDQWYVGWKLVHVAESKAIPDITNTGSATRYLCPLTGRDNTHLVQPPDPQTGSYATKNPQCIIDRHQWLGDITGAATPSSHIPTYVDLWHEGRLAKGVTVSRSGYLVVPDNPMFTRLGSTGVKKHVEHSLFLPINKIFNTSKIADRGKIPSYEQSYIILWAYNETLGYGSSTNTPAIHMNWVHRFRDP